MKKLNLKRVKITFKNDLIRSFGEFGEVNHIDTKMSCNGKRFIVEIYYEPFVKETKHVESFIFGIDEILSIEQKWF